MSKTITEKLNMIKDAAEIFMTAYLLANGEDNFDEYLIGEPDDPEKKQLAFYLDDDADGTAKEIFKVLIQAQLYKTSTVKSYVYQQGLKEFLKDFEPELIEMEIRGDMAGDNWPLLQNSSSIVYYRVNYENEVDDCD